MWVLVPFLAGLALLWFGAPHWKRVTRVYGVRHDGRIGVRREGIDYPASPRADRYGVITIRIFVVIGLICAVSVVIQDH